MGKLYEMSICSGTQNIYHLDLYSFKFIAYDMDNKV